MRTIIDKLFNRKKTNNEKQIELLSQEMPESEKEKKLKKNQLRFAWNKIKPKKISFLAIQNPEDIELLGEEEPIVQKKEKPHLAKRKIKYVTSCIVILIVITTILSFTTEKNVMKVTAKNFLSRMGIYTEEIKNVEIESNNYDNPGSWHIDKSAKWTSSSTVQVTFDVNSIIKTGEHNKDVILVLDISESMSGEKLNKAINDAKELIDYLLTNNQNRIAIITFETNSTILSDFSNDKNDLFEKLDAITIGISTNYDAALKNVDVIMNDYQKRNNCDVVTLFLTDGYPNVDTPSQIGTYELLKDKYPYMDINGIQYEMGIEVVDEIKQITDSQWIADKTTLNNVLFEASLNPAGYEKFIITDYVNDDYFQIDSISDIKVSKGSIALEEESGTPKITWDLGDNSYMTGGKAKMTIDLKLKSQYVGNEGYFPTNKKENVSYKIEDAVKSVVSTSTPVLKNLYKVIYDTNTPDGCNLPNIESENHLIYQNVEKKNTELSCEGYLFKGWEIDDDSAKDITIVNDDVFVMPTHDVTIRATWSRQAIAKSMDGTVYEKTTLYKVLQNEAANETYATEYDGAHQDSMDESKSTEKIYYYFAPYSTTGNTVKNMNNVLFAGHCWQMIRTTDTGGVKMIYNGEAENNKCLNTRGTHVGYYSRSSEKLSSYYWYGTDYTYDKSAKTFKISGTTERVKWSQTNGPGLIGKYTCKLDNVDGSCSTIYLVESYNDASNAYVIPLNSSSHYSQFGTLKFNSGSSLPVDVSYMYAKRYGNSRKDLAKTMTILSTGTLSTTYWYADSATWGSPVENRYNLDDPYQISNTIAYRNLVGKYTFRNKNQDYTNLSVQYITGVNNSNFYYILLGNEAGTTHDLDYYNYTYTYGDSYTKNEDGTYTVNDAETIYKTEWFSKYRNIKAGNYLCINAVDDTCSDLLHVVSTDNSTLTYMEVDKNVYKYAKGFTWDGSKYILDEATSVSFWNAREKIYSSIPNAHYTCWNETGECTNLYYVYYSYSSGSYEQYYITLTDGKSINDALDEMLHINSVNSIMKSGLEAWYKHYLAENYDDYIEDTIFCNDRSTNSLGGWNPNGGSGTLQFKNYKLTTDLSCPNMTDRFSISNSSAPLDYKVGLMTAPEMSLAGAGLSNTGQMYWLNTPAYHYSASIYGYYVYEGGSVWEQQYSYSSALGVRPAISLKPGIEYSDGDGSMESPYIIDLES